MLCIMAQMIGSMPVQVHTDGRSAAQSHRKHMRVENRDLREEVSLPFCVFAGAVHCTAEATLWRTCTCQRELASSAGCCRSAFLCIANRIQLVQHRQQCQHATMQTTSFLYACHSQLQIIDTLSCAFCSRPSTCERTWLLPVWCYSFRHMEGARLWAAPQCFLLWSHWTWLPSTWPLCLLVERGPQQQTHQGECSALHALLTS